MFHPICHPLTSDAVGYQKEAKLSIISVLIGHLNADAQQGMDIRRLLEECDTLDPADPDGSVEAMRDRLRDTIASNVTREDSRSAAFCLSAVHDMEPTADGISRIRTETERMDAEWRERFDRRLTNAVECLRGAFGNGQEPVSFLSGLLGCYSVVMYSDPDGALYRYNDEMLSSGHDRRIEEALEGSS